MELVLVGAEMAHVNLLAHLRKKPLPGVRLTLITPKPQRIYPAMLAGFVAGRHPLDVCTISLESLIQPLAAQGSARWLIGRVAEIDATASAMLLDDGQVVKFDVLSINTEPLHDLDALERAMPGAREHGLFVRPIDAFCALWPRVPELAAERALRIAVIGGLANDLVNDLASKPANVLANDPTHQQAIELSLAIRHRLPTSAVTLITGGEPLGHDAPPRLQRCLADALRQRNVTVLADSAMQITTGEIQLGSGARLACDVPIIATGVMRRPPPWLVESGLAVDSQGLIAVNANGQSAAHPKLFITGQRGASSRLASSRSTEAEAQRLATSLTTPLTNELVTPLTGDAAQGQNGIRLISCGDGRAIAAWGNFATQGLWAGWTKEWLDRATLVRYHEKKG